MAQLFTKDPVLETVELALGLKKEVLRRGAEGGSKPTTGQEVFAHYTGKLLSGQEFDSSRSRGKPFRFRIGIGQVIKGWDLGIASMVVGERCVLTCSSDMGYGDSGAPPDIPGGATLAFDVEMLPAVAPESGGCAIQ